MCRLALMNKAGADFIEKTYGLTAFLTYLESRLGGHGNGYALIKDGKCVDLRKGVNLTNRTIVKAVKKIYHQFADFEKGCYSTEKVLGAFYIIVNVFHDDEGPYLTMNISLNDIYDGVSWT